MNQSEVLAITCNLLKARKNCALEVATDFVANHEAKGCNRNRVITFDSHLKTAASMTISN